MSRYHPDSLPPWKTYPPGPGGPAAGTINAIRLDHAGNLWFGTDGVSRYDGTSWTTYPLAGTVTSIEEDVDRNLWFSSAVGVSRFDGRTWKNHRATDGLASNTVHALRFDRSGNLWSGTNGGVSRFDGVSGRT